MTDPLPPYSGDTSTCPKCRGFEATVDYTRGIPTIVHGSGGDHTLLNRMDDARECLLRTCRDCGWAWLEACADAPVEMVTEIPTDTGGSIEFREPVTRTWAENFRDQLMRGMPTAPLHPMRSSD